MSSIFLTSQVSTGMAVEENDDKPINILEEIEQPSFTTIDGQKAGSFSLYNQGQIRRLGSKGSSSVLDCIGGKSWILVNF